MVCRSFWSWSREATMMRWSRLSQLPASGARASRLSRASTSRGEGMGRMASARAMVVAEFLERSPMKRAASGSARAARSAGERSKEPLAVEGKKVRLGSGGSLGRRASGSRVATVWMGNWRARYSEIRTGVEKLWLLPPRTATRPVLRSGRFQARSVKRGCLAFCQ